MGVYGFCAVVEPGLANIANVGFSKGTTGRTLCNPQRTGGAVRFLTLSLPTSHGPESSEPPRTDGLTSAGGGLHQPTLSGTVSFSIAELWRRDSYAAPSENNITPPGLYRFRCAISQG